MRRKSPKWIDEFLAATINAISASGESAWFPFSAYRFYPLMADLDIERWDAVVSRTEEKGLTPRALVQAITGPETIRAELHYMLHAVKVADEWNTDRAQRVLDFLHELCQACCTDDPYGFTSARIHTPQEVKDIVQQTPWHIVEDRAAAREVGNLIMAAIHLAYAYYGDICYPQWFEVLGPYALGDGREFLIRTYPNFRPIEVWSNGPFPTFHSMEIRAIYKGASIVLDQWSHIQTQKNLAECIRECAVQIDGHWAEPAQWPTLTEELGNTAAAIQNQWRIFDFESTKQQFLKLRWYQFRDLFQLLGLDWRPTQVMWDRVRGRNLLPEATPEFRTLEEAKTWWVTFLDPRTQEGLPLSYRRPWEVKVKK